MRRWTWPVALWVRLYTLGLPSSVRRARQAELASDLWEETQAASAQGTPRLRFAMSIWARCLLGAADDLFWRVEQRSLGRRGLDQARAPVPGTGTPRARLLGLSAGLGLALGLILLIVVVNTVRYVDGTQPGGVAAATLLALAVGIALVGCLVAARGLWIMPARIAEGAILAVGGSTAAGLAWYWLLIPTLLAVTVSAYAVARAVRMTRARART